MDTAGDTIKVGLVMAPNSHRGAGSCHHLGAQ